MAASLLNIKSDTRFIQRLKNKESLAWSQFIDEWGNHLYSYLQHNLLDRAIIEKTFSEIMAVLVRTISKYSHRTPFAIFVYHIAAKTIASLNPAKSTTSNDPGQVSDQFQQALLHLSPITRQAMLLYYRIGFSVAEVAQVLGQSRKATERQLEQGISLFRDQKLIGGRPGHRHVSALDDTSSVNSTRSSRKQQNVFK